MEATKHAAKRLKARSGLKKRDANKFAELAMSAGYSEARFNGNLRKYLDSIMHKHRGNRVRVFMDQIYIFKKDFLVTVYSLPGQFNGKWKKYLKVKE